MKIQRLSFANKTQPFVWEYARIGNQTIKVMRLFGRYFITKDQ